MSLTAITVDYTVSDFGLPGHVDAGKSTLMGRLVYELGQMNEKKRRENERESTKVGKGSFQWAWEMDAMSEERDRWVLILSGLGESMRATHLHPEA